ncbi:fluoride efflux transporter CrcB [Gordonia sp. OPL2]|uniref:fluoride efflux transporter CrcB n=1 Tax=Gordonia sp. OPL2 TaxID=2486274 RepID=UPI0016564B64|nr:fluoride efflux transporter CrcB [Gordonia sp. OPL2]ROZ93707.1 fluoride efflux transporter CrcB [Gordonia sp. OPL2]
MAADHDRAHGPGDDRPALPVDPDTPPRPLHRQPAALVWVFCGGIVGTGLRYMIEEAWPTTSGAWPWATFAVNLCGAFLLGALLAGLAHLGSDEGWRQRTRLLVGTGVCGSFTTYSTFALEISLLGRDGAVPTAIAYAVISVVGGVVAAWSGIVLADIGFRRREVTT